jgi:hypothetical protein
MRSAMLPGGSAALLDESAALLDDPAVLLDDSAKLPDDSAKLPDDSAELLDDPAMLPGQSAMLRGQSTTMPGHFSMMPERKGRRLRFRIQSIIIINRRICQGYDLFVRLFLAMLEGIKRGQREHISLEVLAKNLGLHVWADMRCVP